MRIELLVINGCPNSAIAAQRMHLALAKMGKPHEQVAQRVLTTSADIQGTAFAGSPTITVDGVDLFDSQPTEELACRVYRTPEGLQGSPSVEQLTEALAARNDE
ncbi:MAG: thioredoxin family protein [Glutamicibacter ardleyensis]|uniref:thioredoxin family protein n=1 Tax=Glutamicibacter ardleyensis TaxID=225894 RepID=UPI003FB8A23C